MSVPCTLEVPRVAALPSLGGGKEVRRPGGRGPPTTGLELAWTRTDFFLYQLHSTNEKTEMRA